MKKLSSLIGILLVSTIAQATTPGWQNYVDVDELIFEEEQNGTRAYVTFSTRYDLDACSANSIHIRVYGDTKKGEYILTTLLTAIAAGKQVRPLIEGCDDWGRAVVTGVRFK